MPAADVDLAGVPTLSPQYARLPFPSLTRSHILHCSYHYWYPKYRTLTPKARLVPLPDPFLSFLRADGIILPPETPQVRPCPEPLTPPPSDSDSDDWDDEDSDPSEEWLEVHENIQDTIRELGGSVVPKLNWSAPKDATWISATNSMECQTANDIYLLLKSSDFITHDLEQVWDGCEEESISASERVGNDGAMDQDNHAGEPRFPYFLVLRKNMPALNPALEFRCFVRSRQLLCICQRDLNHFSFLPALVPKFRTMIQDWFTRNLAQTFPDQNLAFDVYIPPPHDKVWLIDINPWAVRTDPLLFSWLEILTMPEPEHAVAIALQAEVSDENGADDEQSSDKEEEIFTPEFRLVKKDDPEAYAFNTPKYSAHKLPKDVVDAGLDGEAGLREFMGTWREMTDR